MKNFFPLQNEIFDLGLCAGEIAVYAYLVRCANRKTDICWPSYRTIGAATGMCKNTVRKYVHSLEDKCLIYFEPSEVIRHGRKQNGNLLYTIRPIEDAIEYDQRRQEARIEEEAILQQMMLRIEEYNRKHPQAPVMLTLGEETG